MYINAHPLLGATAALAAVASASASASAYIPNIHARQSLASMVGAPPTSAPGDYGDGDGGISDECQSAIAGLVPLYSELPTPPPLLLTATEILTDPCMTTPSFEGTELEQWESYTSAALGWYSSHSEALDDALQSCSELQDFGEASVPVCTGTGTGMGTGPVASPTSEGEDEGDDATTTGDSADEPTSTADDSGSSDESASIAATATPTEDAAKSSTSSSETPTSDAGSSSPTPVPGAAPREKGVIVAGLAIVAAGFWGFML